MDRLPLGITVYRLATGALAPLAPLLLRRRILRGKEHHERSDERFGIASQQHNEDIRQILGKILETTH